MDAPSLSEDASGAAANNTKKGGGGKKIGGRNDGGGDDDVATNDGGGDVAAARSTQGLVVKTFAGKPRSSADPSLSVSDIAGALRFFRGQCKEGLVSALKTPHGVGWKSATPVAWILKLEVLFAKLLASVPTGLLTSRKSKEAFRRLHDEERLSAKPLEKYQLDDLVDTLDVSLRMVLAHLRDLKISQLAWERVLKKASNEQVDRLKNLLGMIVISSGPAVVVQKKEHNPPPGSRQNSFGSQASSSNNGDGAATEVGDIFPGRLSPTKQRDVAACCFADVDFSSCSSLLKVTTTFKVVEMMWPTCSQDPTTTATSCRARSFKWCCKERMHSWKAMIPAMHHRCQKLMMRMALPRRVCSRTLSSLTGGTRRMRARREQGGAHHP